MLIVIGVFAVILATVFITFLVLPAFATSTEYDSNFTVIDYVRNYSVDLSFPNLADYGTRGSCQATNSTHFCILTIYISLNLNGVPPSNFYVKSMTIELHDAFFSSVGLLQGTDDGSIGSSHTFLEPGTQILTITPPKCGGCTWTETVVIWNAPYNSNGTIVLDITLGAQVVASGTFGSTIHDLSAEISLPNSTSV